MPTAFSQLRADLVAVGEDREGEEQRMLLPSKAQAVQKSLGLLVRSVRYVLGAGLGPCDMGETVLRKLCKDGCAHRCVFSQLRKKFLSIAQKS